MDYSEYHWTSGDRLTMFARQWAASLEPKGTVCIVHGIGEHSGRFASLAKALTDEGFHVVVPDLRGHGRSAGKRGHIASYEALMEDIDIFLKQGIRPDFRRLPLFLYGHSLGGNLVLNYALRRKPALAGIIASAPWLELAFEPPAYKIQLGKIMDRIWPSFSQPNGLDLKALSRNADVIKGYRDDPLVHDRVSARMYLSVRGAGLWALEHADEFQLPLLIMHGSGDRVTSLKASESFAERAKEFSTLMVWKGFYHEIHNEPYNEEMLAYVIGWIKMTAEVPAKGPINLRI